MTSTTRPYSSSGYNGLMDWLGKGKSDGGAWQHPATSRGYVTCSTHTEYSGSFAVENVFAQSASTCWHSKDTTDLVKTAQELRFDFGDGRIVPTHFAMQARNPYECVPSEFRLVASADGVEWDELLHESGLTAGGDGSWQDFAITGADASGYRFFHFLIPHDDVSVTSYAWHSIGEFEFYGSYSDGHDDTDPTQVRCPFFQPGFNGLIDWLGRGGSFFGTFVEGGEFDAVDWSSTSNPLSNHGNKALDHYNDAYFSSTNAAGSWWRADLGSGIAWYVEKVGIYGAVTNPRNFKIQGSNDDTASPTNWTDLATVTGDGPDNDDWFAVDIASPAGYRHYRVLNTGADAAATNFLQIAEIEFWGYSYVPETPPEPPTFEGLWQYGTEFRVEIGLAGEGGSGAAVWGTSKWGTGTWTGYAPDWYDVSPYVIGAVAEYGAESFDERMRTGHARFLLDNDSGAFNPDSGAALASDLSLRPGRWIRLIGAISTYQRVLWQGYIDTIEEVYLPAASGSNTVLHCFDFAGLLALDNPPALDSAVGAGERTSARANRILNEFGPVSGGWPWRQVEPGIHTLRASSLAQNRLEEIQRAAQAEGGAFYFEGPNARFRPFSWLSTNPRSTAVQIQPGSGTAGHPGVTGADAAKRSARTIRNDIQVARAEGTVQRFQDLASQALFGGVPRTWQYLAYENNKDTHVKALGERILAAYAYDRQTLRRVTMEPVDAASAQRLLDLRLGDLAEITVPDDLMGWGYSTEAHVLGIRYEIDNTDWEVKVRLDQSQTTQE